jgi:shikimate dehydrogenase
MHKQNLKKAFVCGWPIEHSRSPIIHSYWLEKYQLKGTYEKIAVSPDDLSEFLVDLKKSGFIGGNFTIPHKEKIASHVLNIDDAAKNIGAVNTVWFEDDRLMGGNTDWLGFSANLDDWADGWADREKLDRPLIVLGAGGAARGVLYALQQRGFTNIFLVNRTRSNAEKIAKEFSINIKTASLEEISALPLDISLLVNTSSLGMSGKSQLPQDLIDYIGNVSKDAVVNDIVYIPLETELLKIASKANLKTVDGLGMLLHQAVPGFEHWFGIKPEVTQELRDLVLKDIGQV